MSEKPASADHRLYVPQHKLWAVHVMSGGDKQYCYDREPGQEYFHLIVPGELYLQSGDEKLCLNCARRRGVVSANRLFWQDRGT
ncbi:MAG: hypothetical protein R3B90_10985 [Planctomycetaceae bacterium]